MPGIFPARKTNEGICVLLRQVVRVEHVCSYFAAKSPAPVRQNGSAKAMKTFCANCFFLKSDFRAGAIAFQAARSRQRKCPLRTFQAPRPVARGTSRASGCPGNNFGTATKCRRISSTFAGGSQSTINTKANYMNTVTTEPKNRRFPNPQELLNPTCRFYDKAQLLAQWDKEHAGQAAGEIALEYRRARATCRLPARLKTLRIAPHRIGRKN